MNELETNPILEFNPNQMTEIRELFGYSDINRLHQDLRIFKDWIKMQQHFVIKEFPNEFLERYLISSKGSIERAKKRLDKLCTLRRLMPEYLQNYDIENEFTNLLKVCQLCLLPKPTPENYRIIYYNVHNPDASAIFEHIRSARYIVVILEYLYCHDYNAGIQIVVDTRNITFGVVSKFSPLVVANTVMLITEAFGLRFRGLQILSGSKVIDALLTVLKQGMSKKLTARIHIHEDNESLFKLIPKDRFPSDIGGDLGSLEEINANNFKEFSSPEFIKKMKYMEGASTNESNRLRSTFNQEYSGMPGSFKVLSVD